MSLGRVTLVFELWDHQYMAEVGISFDFSHLESLALTADFS